MAPGVKEYIGQLIQLARLGREEKEGGGIDAKKEDIQENAGLSN